MMIWTPITFGVIMFVAFTFLYCCWRVRHLRTRGLSSSSSVQVSAIIPEPQQQQLPKQQFGIEKEVLDAFPTIKANELQVGMQEEENSQCPICLVEYEAFEVLRRLPICGHIFHTTCVDSWLNKQPTCPVCRIILSTEVAEASSSDHERNRSSAAPATSPVLEPHYYRAPSATSTALTVGLAAPSTPPSWILVNRPLPLPPAATAFSSAATSSICSTKTSSSSPYDSSGRSDLEMGNNNNNNNNNFHHTGRMLNDSPVVEYPLLKVTDDTGSRRHAEEGWRSGYLNPVSDCCRSSKSQGDDRKKSCTAASTSSGCNIQIESRGVKNHSINSRRWLTESFSFVLSDSFNADNVVPEHKLEPGGGAAAAGKADLAISIDNKLPPTTTAAAATTKHPTDLDSRASSSMEFSSRRCKKMQGLILRRSPDSESVYESRVSDSHLPLTISTEQCSFQFLPLVLTGSCSADFSFNKSLGTTTNASQILQPANNNKNNHNKETPCA